MKARQAALLVKFAYAMLHAHHVIRAFCVLMEVRKGIDTHHMVGTMLEVISMRGSCSQTRRTTLKFLAQAALNGVSKGESFLSCRFKDTCMPWMHARIVNEIVRQKQLNLHAACSMLPIQERYPHQAC